VGETLRIGSRGSRLALWQANWVQARLTELHPGLAVEIRIIKTLGDKILDVPLAKIGDKGLFTKELEKAILDGEVDLAVHSLKDLPTNLDAGLAIGAVSAREDVRDAFLSPDGKKLADLPPGAVLGTSSLRRRSQLLAAHPLLRVADLRGNVDTRVRKVIDDRQFDGGILALAGLKRLGLADRVTEVLDADRMLPAVGQGALGIEVREGDDRVIARIAPLHDADTAHAVRCERAFLRALEGGCQVPIGALATVDGGGVTFRGFIGDLEGRRTWRTAETFPRGVSPETVGEGVARTLLARGAREVLDEIFAEARSDKR
jgi:hydroxymethylbilane synthase